ncbi:hypothetical protein EJ05DRAFT_538090 [Pseudovirgaria hyperparasitica]|uniref:Cora-domain-containing protein n=1 Tax=Pseudovirgaria hyperparasitica TaxID=470096 RepID=A0A6A6WAD1_9PEZI|nr:uncharacterized protein EJ05DRAFT_538090 [Pseudovirgaria hyperparasitica]KAF2758786.1 hypothetical protein EJ05DRAFT_538090 [Pseudovirgaria hyperparasitica]
MQDLEQEAEVRSTSNGAKTTDCSTLCDKDSHFQQMTTSPSCTATKSTSESHTQFLIPSFNRPTLPPGNEGIFVIGRNVSGGSETSHTFLQSPEDLGVFLREQAEGRILFLRGYPSSEWLSYLGARLNLDYEYLFQHFAHSSHLESGDLLCLPPLSLIATNTIQLYFTTLGVWDNHQSEIGVTEARSKLALSFKSYMDDMIHGKGTKLCDSIVRSFHVHDLKHFSMDQQITIKLLRVEKSWTIIIWSDAGTSLESSHRGPWLDMTADHSSSIRFIPMVLQLQNGQIKDFLTTTMGKTQSSQTSSIATSEQLAQNLCALPHDFLRPLNDFTIQAHPFYALHEIFRLNAASEHQFLNLMETKAHTHGRMDNDRQRSIAEIQAIKQLIDQDHEKITDVLETIRTRGGCHWNPEPQTREADEAREAAETLHRTFRKLERRAHAVSEACRDAISMLSSDAMVREAQKSMKTAEGIAKVTFIAFVFVPLSFTTSFFGMNFAEFNGKNLGIWVWFMVSVPVLMLSLLVWWLDGQKCRRAVSWIRRLSGGRD